MFAIGLGPPGPTSRPEKRVRLGLAPLTSSATVIPSDGPVAVQLQPVLRLPGARNGWVYQVKLSPHDGHRLGERANPNSVPSLAIKIRNRAPAPMPFAPAS
jgi:hypothetical protein